MKRARHSATCSGGGDLASGGRERTVAQALGAPGKARSDGSEPIESTHFNEEALSAASFSLIPMSGG